MEKLQIADYQIQEMKISKYLGSKESVQKSLISRMMYCLP